MSALFKPGSDDAPGVYDLSLILRRLNMLKIDFPVPPGSRHPGGFISLSFITLKEIFQVDEIFDAPGHFFHDVLLFKVNFAIQRTTLGIL